MADDKDNPGKRLKREEKKNTLYVTNPKDVRLKAYQDSLNLSKSNFYIPHGEELFESPIEFQKKFKQVINVLGLKRDDKYIDDTSRYQKGIQPVDYQDYERDYGLYKKNAPYTTIIYKKPERPVVLVKERPKSKPVDLLKVREVPISNITPAEIVSPVKRPTIVPISPTESPFVPAEMASLTREDLVERPIVKRKPPKFILPTQYGGWSREPLLRKLFPKLYMKRTY